MSQTDTSLKHIALNDLHEGLGAKMVPFAGYLMPVQYTGVNDEHVTVREGVGVFDVSHMGEFKVSGPGAFDLVQKVTSNDISVLVDGKVQYSCLPNNEGGIVDDLLVYRHAEEDYLLVVNASNIDKDWAWISSQNEFGASMDNISDEISLLAVQGPKALEVLQPLTSLNLGDMKYYTFQVGEVAGIGDVLISTTGYTGSGGFEIYVKNADAQKLWDKVFESGAPFGIKPIGLAARDTLRLEMGFCLYGNDIDDTTSPIEAGLGWITKPASGCINAELFATQKKEGVTKKLVGFELVDRGIPRQGYDIVNGDGAKIGRVTSGTMSPSISKAIGLGYVEKANSSEDSEIYIAIRNKSVKAKVVKLPFYKG